MKTLTCKTCTATGLISIMDLDTGNWILIDPVASITKTVTHECSPARDMHNAVTEAFNYDQGRGHLCRGKLEAHLADQPFAESYKLEILDAFDTVVPQGFGATCDC